MRLIASLKHLVLSVLVAGVVAALVFGLWYPGSYSALAGGMHLFLLVVVVDVVCGPLLTLIIFNPSKQRRELIKDVSIIVVLQLLILGYGLYTIALARPVYLAFEGNRFRVVTVADIDAATIGQAPPELQDLGFNGPRLIGVKLLQPDDPGYLASIAKSLDGIPPAYRPDRWIPYSDVTDQVKSGMQPVINLKLLNPGAAPQIDNLIKSKSLREDDVGYYPVQSEKSDPENWVVVLDRKSAKPLKFLPYNGWKEN